MFVMEAVCGLNATEVNQALASGSAHQLLIIDCRSFIAFNQGHIVESVNIHCPPILKRRSGGFIALENIVPCEGKRSQLINGNFPNVLVYDDNTQELSQASRDSNLLSVIQSLLKQVDRLTVRFIIGGFEAVRDECPVLCMNQQAKLSNYMRDSYTHKDDDSPCQTVPAEILPHLYLGDVSHSSQRTLLDRLGITAMLNVSSSCENFFQAHFRYMNIQVGDNMDADLLSCFPKIIQFIDSVAEQQGKVLVHCRAGVSRSATVCIAYLMHKRDMSLDAAFEFVVSRRPIIDPNLNFIQQLQKFEASLRSQSQICPQANSAPTPSTTALPNMFTFLPERLKLYVDQDMDMTPLIPNSPPETHQQTQNNHTVPRSNPNSSAAFQVLQNIVVSPCDLSKTVVFANTSPPAAYPAPRPMSLPLLQVSGPVSPSLPRTTEASVRSSHLSPSAHQSPYQVSPSARQSPYPVSSSTHQTPFPISPSAHQSPFQVAPLLNIFHEPPDGSEAYLDNYVNIPRTPLISRTFSFLSPDIVTCQAVTISSDMTSSRLCRPTTPSALETNPAAFKHSFPAVSLSSPLSPLGVPLSPLPSCG